MSGVISPKKSTRTKYSATARGGFSAASFQSYRLPSSIVLALVRAGNYSLSKSSWACYRTAENHLVRCESDTGVRMRFPMTNRMVLAFIGWLIDVRKLSSSSISQYVSGLRSVHLRNGVLPGNLRPDIVGSIITGRAHEEQQRPDKAPRLAMTLTVMDLLKHLITASSMAHEEKRLLWVVCCLAFYGSFRIHELLSREGAFFDPTCTLMGSGVKLVVKEVAGVREEILMVHLKSLKEDRLGKGVTVELFSTGTSSCPVDAWRKWRKVSKVATAPSKPLFRLPSGLCLTGALFNKKLKSLLGSVINYAEKRFLSHSFRAGSWFMVYCV